MVDAFRATETVSSVTQGESSVRSREMICGAVIFISSALMGRSLTYWLLGGRGVNRVYAEALDCKSGMARIEHAHLNIVRSVRNINSYNNFRRLTVRI